MKRLLRDQWVGALRSGEFPQGRIRLVRSPDIGHAQATFCCMGVLCEIASPFTRSQMESATQIDAPAYRWIAEQLGDKMPDTYDTFQMRPDKASFIRRLATLNDLDGWTFAEIADWIEANIPCQD